MKRCLDFAALCINFIIKLSPSWNVISRLDNMRVEPGAKRKSGKLRVGGGEIMANLNCMSARGINLITGLFLLVLGLLLFVGGFTIIPMFGFLFAVPVVVLSFYFLFAPRDRTCFPYRKNL